MPGRSRSPTFRQGMAERYEIVIDFAKYPHGQRVVLQNLQPKNNIDYDDTDKIMAFDVVGDAARRSTSNAIPAAAQPGQRR